MKKKAFPYLLNWALITIVLISLAIIKNFIPFGSRSMLTVDLGQQYIDFFSLFRKTLLGNPEQFFYSFEKGFGGEMIGLWAYYLMSPFNIILLFFNEESLAYGVTLLTYLKIMSASMTFFYFTQKKYALSPILSITFSQCYALMSYVIIYMLNIMWLDGLVLLPLIALGLDHIIKTGKSKLYVLSLSTLFIANYYIGYMVAIFLIFYAVFVISESALNWRDAIKAYGQFVLQSLLSGLLSAILIIPTASSLLTNKATHMQTDFNWETAHSPVDIASKFFIGSFNFDEMSKGSPNLYAGLFVFILAVYFFFAKKIQWREKITAILVIIPFYLGFHFKLVDRLWHGGQFPIWYHFRFSFITCFFLIVLAIKAYQARANKLKLWQSILMIVVIASFTFYYYFLGSDYEFLTPTHLFISLIFALSFILIWYFDFITPTLMPFVLLSFVIGELLTNATFILNELSYVDANKFSDYVTILDQSLAQLRHSNDTFYRIHSTFQRSKNEAMYTHFDGLNHFGSTIEASAPRLFGYLGLPEGSGFINYTNGTLFTDDLFNIRYLLNPSANTEEYTTSSQYKLFQIATDLDIQAYPIMNVQPRYVVHENKERLGLGIEVSEQIAENKNPFHDHQPIQNQEYLLQLIDFTGTGKPYYHSVPIQDGQLNQVTISDQGDGDYYLYERSYQSDSSLKTPDSSDHYFEMKFHTTSNNPYYFTLPSQYDGDKVRMKLNDDTYRFYGTYRHRQVTNASYQTKENNQSLKIFLKKDDLQANLVKLYEFDEARYHQMIAKKQASNFNITSFKDTHIEGTMTTEQDQGYILFTIPYDKNWSINLDGQTIQPIPVLNDTLMAIPVTKGVHHIRLHYFPRFFLVGLGISVFGLLTFSWQHWGNQRWKLYQKKKRRQKIEAKRTANLNA